MHLNRRHTDRGEKRNTLRDAVSESRDRTRFQTPFLNQTNQHCVFVISRGKNKQNIKSLLRENIIQQSALKFD